MLTNVLGELTNNTAVRPAIATTAQPESVDICVTLFGTQGSYIRNLFHNLTMPEIGSAKRQLEESTAEVSLSGPALVLLSP
jgi:hypothetical protein